MQYRGTILSSRSLGIDTERKRENKTSSDESTKNEWGWYIRNGIKIQRRRWRNEQAMKRYPEIVIAPVAGWWPSKYASFKLSKKIDELWLFAGVDENWNPSLWKSRDGFLTLRVPKDRQQNVKRMFYRNGLWYSRDRNLWKKRLSFDAWQKRLAKRTSAVQGER